MFTERLHTRCFPWTETLSQLAMRQASSGVQLWIFSQQKQWERETTSLPGLKIGRRYSSEIVSVKFSTMLLAFRGDLLPPSTAQKNNMNQSYGITLQLTVSQSLCRAPFGAHDHIYVLVWTITAFS